MPRTARALVGDICYHVINRGNAQIEVFHKDGDYRAFVELIGRRGNEEITRIISARRASQKERKQYEVKED